MEYTKGIKNSAYLEKIKDAMLAHYKAVSEQVPGQTAYQVAINLAKETVIQDIAHDAGLIIAHDIYGDLTLIPEDGLDV